MNFNVHLLWMGEGRFFSVTPFDKAANPFPYCLSEFMSKCQFNSIISDFRFSNTNPLPYVDKSCKILQMVTAWKDHITSIFLASWEICLNESMFILHSIWTCPGWVFYPWNPHLFGNECHTSCCALSGFLYVVKLVEVKEHPCQAIPLEFEDLDEKTVGLLLRTIKIYFFTGRYVILDSSFCVLKGLIHLSNKGIFACAVILKRRYWPSMV